MDGIFFHLQETSGKIVAVNAGQAVLPLTGDILKITPKINPDDAAVLCTALGDTPRADARMVPGSGS